MNCHRCGNKMTIRTDPKGCDYLLINGCEKKMEDWIDAATQDPAAIQHDTNKVCFYTNQIYLDTKAWK